MKLTGMRLYAVFCAVFVAGVLPLGCTHQDVAQAPGSDANTAPRPVAAPKSTPTAVAEGAKSAGTAPPAVTPQPTAPAGAKPVSKPIAVAIKPGLLGAAPVTGGGAAIPAINPGTVGLAICDPVCTGDASLADFGTGCTHWLHYYVAGQPLFGGSTMWSSMNRAETELKRNDLRLPPAQAIQLFSILGVPYLASTSISGTGLHCTLSLQIMRAPKGALVGVPVTCTGSEQQVATNLPRLAAALAGALGLRNLALPAAALNTPAQLALIGSYGWVGERLHQHNKPVTPAMVALAGRSPLATITVLHGLGQNATACISSSLQTYSANSLIFADALNYKAAYPKNMPAGLAANCKRWPNNCNFLMAHATLNPTYAAVMPALRRCAQLYPNLPGIWANIANWDADQMQLIRNSRTAGNLTAAEWQRLRAIYSDWEHAALKVTNLDSLRPGCWVELATAATFAGDEQTADNAMQKALTTEPDNTAAWGWALQMYQPKWRGDPARLNETIAAAVTKARTNSLFAYDLYQILAGDAMLDRAPGLLSRLFVQLRNDVAAQPLDPGRHVRLAHLDSMSGDMPAARKEFEAAIKLDPTNAALLAEYGTLLGAMDLPALGTAALQRAARLSPRLRAVHYDLGLAYRIAGRNADSMREFRLELANYPVSGQYWLKLVNVAYGDDDWQNIIVYWHEAIKRTPTLVADAGEQFVPILAYAYARMANYAAAQKELDEARLHGYENGNIVELAAARVAIQAKRYDEASAECRAAIQMALPDMEPHYLLGMALYKSGSKAEARQEWTVASKAQKSEWTVAAAQALATMK